MSDTARDYQPEDTASTNGLDDLFEEGLPAGVPQGVPEGVPVSEAAAQLGVTERAILKRLRRGTLKGFKVTAKRGKKWLVSKEELPNLEEGLLDVEERLPPGVPSDDLGVPMVEMSMETTDMVDLSTDVSYSPGVLVEEEGLPPGVPSEELGVPSSHSADLISLVNQLQSKLDKANEQLQSASFRNGYLESKLEDKEREIKLLTDSQHKPSNWARFKAWFFGQ